jgi:serpin B
LAGARGRTAAEMAAVLHQTYPDPGYPAAFTALVNQIAGAANGGGNQFLNANALWLQSGLRLEPDFQNIIQAGYQAPLTPVDFAGNPESARDSVNAWTDQHTKGKIRELFAPGSLNGRTRLVLSSAVYFYGKWERPFQSRLTHPGAFQTGTRGPLQTSFMNQTAAFGYAETPLLQILEMKYAGTGLALDILLPRTGASLSDVEGSLTGENLTAWLHELKDRQVEVSIPKFRAESAFSLRDALSHMGMPLAFTGAADFSGIDGRHDLAISEVVHKAFVDVTESGTEAAAATGTSAVLVRMVVPDRIVFRADHPFAFLLRDTRSGMLLFAGRVMTPQS